MKSTDQPGIKASSSIGRHAASYPALRFWIVALTLTQGALLLCAETTVQHTSVFFAKGKYGGWPASHGIWAWGNEILVGFTAGTYQDRGERHHIATNRPVRHLQARSLDGGSTWTVEDPNAKGQLLPEGNALHGTELPGIPLPTWQDSPSSIQFDHPDFAMTLKLNDNHVGPSRFYLSYDRGHNWTGPYRVPAVNGCEIAARTDYWVESGTDCFFFLTAAKTNRREGRPFVAKASRAGASWKFISWIGDEPKGFSIMPSTLKLGPKEFYTVIRHRDVDGRGFRAYRSLDDGQTWTRESDPVADLGAGNPGSLIRLPDDTLCITYGVRAAPFRIAAKFSRDRGRSWSSERIIRHDGSSPDVGYTQSIVRPDGKVVTVYYFSDAITGPERYIAASVWAPQALYANTP